MADNVELASGSGGAILAADEIGGVQHQRVKVQWGADGSANDVSVAQPFPVSVESANDQVDSNNTTTATLAGDAVYTGTGTDILGYAAVTITLYADVDSATDGMTFQFSVDNSNWDDVYTFTMDVSESDTRRFQFPVTAQYFRVVYTNGSGAQSAFRIQTILHAANQLTSVHRLKDSMSGDRSAQVVKTALFARSEENGGTFEPVSVTEDGELEVLNVAHDHGGAKMFRSLDVDETEEQIAATNCNLYWIAGFNVANQTRYLKFYNDTAANVVVGTTTPILTLPLLKEVPFDLTITQGLYFDTALTVAATTGLADNNTGAPSANDVVINVGYMD